MQIVRMPDGRVRIRHGEKYITSMSFEKGFVTKDRTAVYGDNKVIVYDNTTCEELFTLSEVRAIFFPKAIIVETDGLYGAISYDNDCILQILYKNIQYTSGGLIVTCAPRDTEEELKKLAELGVNIDFKKLRALKELYDFEGEQSIRRKFMLYDIKGIYDFRGTCLHKCNILQIRKSPYNKDYMYIYTTNSKCGVYNKNFERIIPEEYEDIYFKKYEIMAVSRRYNVFYLYSGEKKYRIAISYDSEESEIEYFT